MPRVINEIADDLTTLPHSDQSVRLRPAHYGSVVLLTVGIYKKWPDTSDGCYIAAHAKLRRREALNKSGESQVIMQWGISVLLTKVTRPSHVLLSGLMRNQT